MCCDSQTWLPLKFIFHDGELPTTVDLPNIATLVYQMTCKFSNCYVFLDNYFKSHKLAIALAKERVWIVGTIKKNNLPKVVKPLFNIFAKANKKRTRDGDKVV